MPACPGLSRYAAGCPHCRFSESRGDLLQKRVSILAIDHGMKLGSQIYMMRADGDCKKWNVSVSVNFNIVELPFELA